MSARAEPTPNARRVLEARYLRRDAAENHVEGARHVLSRRDQG